MNQDSFWFKDAIFYEAPIKSFLDSNGDGIGDLQGLTQKLDYLQDLGITAIWVLPFYPSPLKDDGYDISEYLDIHPHYGTLNDFQDLVREAHSRDIRVIIELVINHTSDQHPWFQRARKSAKGSKEWNYYVWNDTPEKFKDARIIFKDFEASNWTWDPVAKSYFWHRFYSHQPDLNFHSKEMKEELFKVIDFWFKMGVDGMRLDAIPYLYEREGTSCENLPETHQFLKELRQYVDAHFPNRMLLAEANQWPEDAAHYFGTGDECHMAFHFPIMPRLFMAIHLEDRVPITEIVEQTPDIPESCQWALFLRNHDELTLEMVTDEERDYMFRVYANDPQARINLGIRRRLAPLMKNDRRKIELMNSLLFTLTGAPIIYYGDEIGMGDNIYLGDRNAVRTPMQWNNDRNAGFSRANPQQLYLPIIIDPEYHYETINVEAQQSNPHSLFWWMKRIIALRKKHKAFSRGATQYLNPDNRKILAFLRVYEDETLLIVVNLSRFVQYVRLDLSLFKGMYPLELFSQNAFPPIGDLPYFLTLGSHGFYWFKIEKEAKASHFLPEKGLEQQIPIVEIGKKLSDTFSPSHRKSLEAALANYMSREKEKPHLDSVKIQDCYILQTQTREVYLLIMKVILNAYDSTLYFLPLAIATDPAHHQSLLVKNADRIIARLMDLEQNPAFLYEATEDKDVLELLTGVMTKEQMIADHKTSLQGHFENKETEGVFSFPAEAILIQKNSLRQVFQLQNATLKIYQQISEGMPLDLEIRQFLSHTTFKNFSPLIGYLEYKKEKKEQYALAEIIAFPSLSVMNAKELMLEKAEKFLEDLLLHRELDKLKQSFSNESLMALSKMKVPDDLHAKIGDHLELSGQIGEMTANFHYALQSDCIEAFISQPFDSFYQRSLYQNLRSSLDKLRYICKQSSIDESIQKKRLEIMAHLPKIIDYLSLLLKEKISAFRTRYHGNYTLDHLIYTGKEFLIHDFDRSGVESDSEMRFKRSPLRDASSLCISFIEAAFGAIEKLKQKALISGEMEQNNARKGALKWAGWMSASFLRAYLKDLSKVSFLPGNESHLNFLMSLFMLDEILSKISIGCSQSNLLWVEMSFEALQHWISVYLPSQDRNETQQL
jgi:maltose alpha-D-glucosyltransferase / alpha-amylase